jgi:hypothetical protein
LSMQLDIFWTYPLQQVLHFVDAPHELPLQPGQNAQDVLMRTWWRHPGIQSDVQQQQGIKAAGSHTDWGMRMSDDWAVSLQHLHQVWVSQGGFDIILGFSNGAAAAFLLASVIMHARAHAASSAAAGSVGDPSSGTLQWPGSGRRLRAVVLASGYVPQPLELFVPEGMQVAAAQGLDDATGRERFHACAFLEACPLLCYAHYLLVQLNNHTALQCMLNAATGQQNARHLLQHRMDAGRLSMLPAARAALTLPTWSLSTPGCLCS